MALVFYLAIGIALTAYAWRDITKPWGPIVAIALWPVLLIAGLYLVQRDRDEEARRGRTL